MRKHTKITCFSFKKASLLKEPPSFSSLFYFQIVFSVPAFKLKLPVKLRETTVLVARYDPWSRNTAEDRYSGASQSEMFPTLAAWLSRAYHDSSGNKLAVDFIAGETTLPFGHIRRLENNKLLMTGPVSQGTSVKVICYIVHEEKLFRVQINENKPTGGPDVVCVKWIY